MPRVYLESYGCQMNKLDTELVLGSLMRAGYEAAPTPDEADVILLDTCSVREHAEERVYSRAGSFKRLKRSRPQTVLGIIGCMAQNHQGAILHRLPHVDLVCGPRHLGAIPRLVDQIRQSRVPVVACEDFDDEFVEENHTILGRERAFQAFVKVMEGCDMGCTFCIVPRVRGAEVSRKPDDILNEIRKLQDEGVVEITLLGQTVNSYGKGLKPRTDLASLLHRIHDETQAIRRIRFITSHPALVRKNLVEAMRDLPRVCKALHFPAQSGSNPVLERMRRGYTRERYLELVALLRHEVKGIELASDFIVGFPGETEEDFDLTVELVQHARFTQSFIFKYSPRPGTDCASFPDDVPLEEKKRRNQVLLELQKDISEDVNATRLGSIYEVLVEGPSKTFPNRMSGRTDGHQIVILEDPTVRPGEFVNVRITRATATTLYGERVP